MRCRHLAFTLIITGICLSIFTKPVLAGISDTGVDTANGETLTTNPKSRTMNVTASVVDIVPPTIPILVAPSDGSTLTLTKPQFIWKPSTDDSGIAKYQLWVDGSLKYDNIPTGSTTNTDYTLLFEDSELKLTPKTDFSQGSHTWYIKAFDNNANQSQSATWTFSVDTIAPIVVVTNIGSTTQNIRSDNSSTVPISPIRLTDNSPVISGTGENGSSLQMLVVIPGQANQTTTITMSSGNFSFTLPVLPVNAVINISFTSSDSVGNTSVIVNIPILIEPATIIVPLPSPTAIEVPRPQEVVQQVTQAVTQATTQAPVEQVRLPIVKQVIKAAPETIQAIIANQITQTVAEILPIIAVAAPAAVVVATAVQTSFSLVPYILELISRLLQSLGLIPVKRPRGIVFDVKNGKPIAFATVTFIRAKDNQIIDSVVSDVSGIYRSIKLPPDSYRIEVVHGDYTFPTKFNPTFVVNPHDFYRGEIFEIKSANQEELFLIPMDPLYEQTTTSSKLYIPIALNYVRRLVNNLFYPLAIFSLIMTLLFPTLLNIGIVCLYAILIIRRYLLSKTEPMLKGAITDRTGQPVSNVMIKCIESGSNHVAALLISDDRGEFMAHLVPHQYSLLINKDGFVVDQASKDYSNVFITHPSAEKIITIRLMTIKEAFPDSINNS